MKFARVFELPILAYSTARSAHFAAQYLVLNRLAAALPGDRNPTHPIQTEKGKLLREELKALFRLDAQNIMNQVYPPSVLRPESPFQHILRMPRIMADGLAIYRRRNKGRTTEFKGAARELLEEVPRYYRRNFHFQTNGYLSDHSAQLYEHQVEMLFSGSADAMRRLIIPELRRKFGKGEGKGLRFLEVGAGTGRSTKFVHLAFPKAKIIAVDLSSPYLKQARKQLTGLEHVEFLQADGAKLPFSDGYFDAAYSVFLFHELPMSARKEIIQEAMRVLKPGGCVGMVDSIQLGDKVEFEPLLHQFPHDYHEPFYRDYMSHPVEELFEQAGFSKLHTARGFFSKVVSALKPASLNGS